MPRAKRHPGVYVQETGAAAPAIAGVPTSVAAFVGRAARGPVDAPVALHSFAEYSAAFGGLWTESALGYAVRDYFANGGRTAVVVRAYRAEPGSSGVARLDGGPLALRAASPGAWGGRVRWRLEQADPVAGAGVARTLRVRPADLFHLTVQEVRDDGPLAHEVVTAEEHRHVTLRDSSRRIDRVLAEASQLVRWRGTTAPAPRRVPEAVVDPVTAAQAARNATEARVRAVIDALGAHDGLPLDAASLVGGGEGSARGLYALDGADMINLLCLPPSAPDGDVDPGVLDAAARYVERRRAFLLVDPPTAWSSAEAAIAGVATLGTGSANAAVYFPRLQQPDPLRGDGPSAFVPCGAVAGVMARLDAQRGPWKAPAGAEATLAGVPALALSLTDADQEALNPHGVNALRRLPSAGCVVWGARTLQGDDRLGSDWKYVPVRRTALFLEESLHRGLQWVVFEPNAEPLWARVRQSVETFLHALFRQGAFVGRTPQEGFFVRCDRTTTTAADVASGVVVALVGFAPLQPAEFVVLRIAIAAAAPDA